MGINRASFYRGIIWVVFLLGLGLLIKLGLWQLSRMAEKKAIEQTWAAGQKAAPVPLSKLLSGDTSPQPYQQVLMPSLSFLPNIFLLDNQTQHHQAGYRVFHLALENTAASSVPTAFLIEGPWLPYGATDNGRDFEGVLMAPPVLLPSVAYVRFPSRGLALSAQAYQHPVKWPLLLQWIDTAAIGRLMGMPVAPFWIQFDKPRLPALSPEKHLGYAVQWFLFSGLWAGYGGYLLCRRQKRRFH